ncbi:DUF2628 domain-containing protein [Breoghania sp.]|uniref:DUF2628 domain-containing protein n=1 Tax=Breoghania sp. TaxID=2065378 RepID=UPI0026101B0B|nr:DUF2628 domain-containing protein [Breoghania sp.]MDJ0931333.1 DUF2628 domain-containing protein [Breoghania sp.]
MVERNSTFGRRGLNQEVREFVQRESSSEESLLRTFIGPNADKFLQLHEKKQVRKRAWRFNWTAFFFTLPWLFYRKMYLYGIVVLLIPILIALIFPRLSSSSGLGLAVAIGMQGSGFYLDAVRRRIGKIEALGLPAAERDDLLRERRGVSAIGASFGALIVIALMNLPFVLQAVAKLPACDDPGAVQITRNALQKSFQEDGTTAKSLDLTDFKQQSADTDKDRRVCSFTAMVDGRAVGYFAELTWHNREELQYQVKVFKDLQELRR